MQFQTEFDGIKEELVQQILAELRTFTCEFSTDNPYVSGYGRSTFSFSLKKERGREVTATPSGFGEVLIHNDAAFRSAVSEVPFGDLKRGMFFYN